MVSFEELTDAEEGQVIGVRQDSGPGEDDYLVEFLNSREGIELNRAFLKIDDARARRAVLELVRSLADIKI